MNDYLIILILSVTVLLCYAVDILSQRIKIPSVLFLILIGIGLRFVLDSFQFGIPFLEELVPIVGTLGLILIVLEGSLDLELTPDKYRIIRTTFVSSLLLMALSVIFTVVVFRQLYQQSMYVTILNAVPLGIISSAIAIPSVATLPLKSREFVIYETSMSDVFGVMLFNFVLANAVITVGSFVMFGVNLVVVVLISFVLVLLVALLMAKIKRSVKFIPLISIVFLVYSATKLYHYSGLILIIILGLILNNTDFLLPRRVRELIKTDKLKAELPQFKGIIMELTFLVKIFFFILFGLSTSLKELLDIRSIGVAAVLVLFFIGVRLLFFRFVIRESVMPVGFIAPRGLVTILLMLSIPRELLLIGFSNGILIWVVLLSIVVMSISVASSKPQAAKPE